MPSSRVELRVAEVLLAVPASVGVEAGLVVLTEQQAPGRSLRIMIGQPEARAIQAARDGSTASRPSTWDLFVSVVGLLGGHLDAAVITGVEQERHYFAILEIEDNGERRVVACRPSDAVALALRSYNATLYAEEAVLDEAGVLPDGSKPGRRDRAEESAHSIRERQLAEREAAVAAREQQLAVREAALRASEPPAPHAPTDGDLATGNGAS